MGRESKSPAFERMKKQLVFYLIMGVLCFSIGVWPFPIRVQAEERGDFPPDLTMVPPQRLLELHESTPQQIKRKAIEEALLAGRENSLPVLRQTLITGNETQKLFSLGLLMEMRDRESGGILLHLLTDKSLKVQRRTAYAFGHLKNEEAYNALVNVLRTTQDVGVIKSGLAGLGMLGSKKAVPFLRGWLDHLDASVRVNAAISLAALESEEGLTEVIQASMGEDNQTRREGTFGLGFFQDPRARSRLQKIIDDPETPWKNEAQIALWKIDLSAQSPPDRLPLLQKLLGHPNRAVSKWAIDETAELGTPEAIGALQSMAADPSGSGRHARRKLLALGRLK